MAFASFVQGSRDSLDSTRRVGRVARACHGGFYQGCQGDCTRAYGGGEANRGLPSLHNNDLSVRFPRMISRWTAQWPSLARVSSPGGERTKSLVRLSGCLARGAQSQRWFHDLGHGRRRGKIGERVLGVRLCQGLQSHVWNRRCCPARLAAPTGAGHGAYSP